MESRRWVGLLTSPKPATASDGLVDHASSGRTDPTVCSAEAPFPRARLGESHYYS
jgi:hypothetical protein